MKNNSTRIHVNELRLGMYISELDMPWEKSPFKVHGFFILKREELAEIQACSTYVYIDVEKQKRQFGAIPTKLTDERNRVDFHKAFGKAAESYRHTHTLVKNVMADIRFGHQLNTKVVKEAVSECVDKVLDHPDTMLLLTQLKNMDEYTSEHSINVCILSILLGKQLNYSSADLNTVGLCGLLHDMGKSKIPLEILNKPGRLLPDEMIIMQSHPELGREILMMTADISQEAIDAAYSHHERLNGSGYPRGLQSSAISTFTKIVTIADTYDAITSDRVYQEGKLHLEAIKILAQARNTDFDNDLVIKFADCIGIYPVGNPIQMTNGEVGMIIESNPDNKLKPKVLLLLDAQKKPRQEKLIDTADPTLVDGNGEPYKLGKVIKQNAYGLNLRKYHDNGTLSRLITQKN
ncbi:MAG: HD-GYP domain-containing protein [Methylococcales bacterium]|nr:HD-GYP domain-containing protein [Methylococcales bacterium]